MPTTPDPRRIAQSFGVDAARYDRARPRYPAALISRLAESGPEVLDVGTGTGIVARQLRDAGCRVLGVEPDPRMAEAARAHGLTVEESRFEEWDPAGRTFDTVVAGQTWHWVDPAAGSAQAARVLRPGGRLALFWNAYRPPAELAAAFGEVYRRVAPSLPFDPWQVADPYATVAEKTIAGIGPEFTAPEVWRYEWEHEYTREEWLDLVPTAGGHTLLPPAELSALIDGLGEVTGERFTMPYTTVAVTAVTAG
ncbi:methyltransferase type 11 [Actinoplanes philippinensis]|uniref:Methyltransferase domain-containing protein n=1 Tax=Actinoplanes philippinensis TaxID=35752 RepID=A0A1I1ZXH3_9ACTN|nr:class I SAM-dependent methyltransferase [Actinoplanes philippinensis]GIE75222.1 methyltransferase type 11 [Actinoplanes philippinensis]SFE36524.1 Methyltransferase domain-containing protein [Actinoplanes philippinensis]